MRNTQPKYWSLSVGSRERVDELVDIALGNGGSAYNEPMDQDVSTLIQHQVKIDNR